jgi:hypothetical protein
MESFEAPIRYKLILGKFQVTRIIEQGALLEFHIHLPGLGYLMCTGPKADVKEGDLLTLYTEVLANDKSSRSPVQ